MIGENIRLAFVSLKANKFRTFLTMLGIIIGVASIISILTVSDAMSKSIMESMGSMGANTITFYLEKRDTDEHAVVRNMRDSDKFTDNMFHEILRTFAGTIEGISLSEDIGSMTIEQGDKKAKIKLTGVNATKLALKKLTIINGRTLESSDYSQGLKVAVVSDKFLRKLGYSKFEDAMGKQIETLVGTKYADFTMVGVYEYQENMDEDFGEKGPNSPTDVFIPLEVASALIKSEGKYTYFDVVAASGTKDIMAVLDKVLDYINNTYYEDNDAYHASGYTMKIYVDETKTMLNRLQMAFTAVGAISLLVGGIGVMNIMIVSIVERTREIGTRKALGATNGDIRLQFITEAMVVCFIGGILGVLLGMAFGIAACGMMGYPGFPPVTGVIGCLVFSMVFGVFFGYYPANKAAHLNPIDALRYE